MDVKGTHLWRNKNGGRLRIYLVFVVVKTTRSVQMKRPSGVDSSTSTDDFEDYLQSQQDNDSHQPVDAFVGTWTLHIFIWYFSVCGRGVDLFRIMPVAKTPRKKRLMNLSKRETCEVQRLGERGRLPLCKGTLISAGSRIFLRGVRQLPKVLLDYLAICLPKTAWKWKNLDSLGSANANYFKLLGLFKHKSH